MQRLTAGWRLAGRCQALTSLGAEACGAARECSAISGGGVAAAGVQWQQLRFASKKQGGSTQNTKDSQPKYLGVKLFGGQKCIAGNIIMRQRGTEFHPGTNVGMGRDHTIYSLIEGRVRFSRDTRTKRRYISVDPPLDSDTAAGAQQQQQQRLVPAATQQLQQQPAL
ncbi:hypothetical protein D9Q98_006553 [Chlorella vulgaris]|uniref:Ribosomal protein L27 n=1 Tax=Chlorella vulgaris TaxID=3077 RepID=A0A9D4YV65_CHLVU|nr:hypothetical protein D9Q98_006553 [Chlorella vulgaris]